MIDRVVITKMSSVAIFLLSLLISTLALANSEKRKIIIDCDPGIDDALALTLALQYPGFEILGITTTFGNADLEQTTQNALKIVELSGQSVPVFKGAGKPLVVVSDAPPDFVHGHDGLGNTDQTLAAQHAQDKPAAQFLVDMANQYPGQITLVAIGRLTNLAQAIRQDPTFAGNIQQVVMMGGTLYTPGNVSPVAEANVAGDPHAADIIFTAPWKVTMLGLDVTTKVRIDDKMLTRVKARNQRFGEFVYAITRFYADFHQQQQIEGGFYVHDPSALVYLVDPALFTVKQGPLRVATQGIAIGQTIMAAYPYQYEMPPWQGQPMVTAAVGVDKKGFERKLETLLLGETQHVSSLTRGKTN